MGDCRQTLRATELGEYIRYRSCERRLKLDHDHHRLANRLPFFYPLASPLDPVLQEAGRKREREWEAAVRAAGLFDLCRYDQRPGQETTPWESFCGLARLAPAGTGAYGREIEVTAALGAFQVVGQIDFAILRWRGERPVLRLVECKASRRDRTYHRVQLVLYRLLVRHRLEAVPLLLHGSRVDPEAVECVVARIDQTSNAAQDILELPPLDLAMEEADVLELLAAGGPLERILATPVEELDYQLDARCDDCALNVHCLPESARQRRLELLGIDPATVRALRAAGVPNLDSLAQMEHSGPVGAAVRADPGFTENLESLVLKARARRQTLPVVGTGGLTPDPSPQTAWRGVTKLPPPGGVAPPGGSSQPPVSPPVGAVSLVPPLHVVGGEGLGVRTAQSANARDPAVLPIPNTGRGQLPEHVVSGHRLARVFVSVHYDYVENRVGAIAAHVTRSDRPLATLFARVGEGWRPDPDVREQWPVGKNSDGRTKFEERPLQGEELVGIIPQAWCGEYDRDTRREADLLQRFFSRVVDAIRALCPSGRAPVHFYFWSRGEVARLVEACCRCDSALLGHLRELLGCRAGLEQLIYSTLEDEVTQRFALGWTGRGLSVVASLRWFGRSFHWTRRVGDDTVQLDRVFQQDLFDFRALLRYSAGESGQPWRPLDDPEADRHPFEVRACFQDALPVPYWRAYWGTLPDPEEAGQNHKVAAALRRYHAAGQPGMLRAYLRARVQALRWVEEGIRHKNPDIDKPLLRTRDLPIFSLGVEDAARASLDFLWLERHVAVNDWLAGHLLSPAQRVPEGKTVPLRDVRPAGENRLEARIDLEGYPLDRAALAVRSSLSEGSFARVNPCSTDPARGQTLGQLLRGGTTCIIETLEWEEGRVTLAAIPNTRPNRYLLPSLPWSADQEGFAAATLDESPSDFVSGRIDGRLQSRLGEHAYRWFDTRQARVPPQVPLPHGRAERYRELLGTLDLGSGGLTPDQARAALEGLSARVQLLQGPPGTGKTQTTAVAALLRILARRHPGELVLVTATTHTAVDTIMERLAGLLPGFDRHARAAGLPMPPVRLARLHSSADGGAGLTPGPSPQTSWRGVTKLPTRGGSIRPGGSLHAGTACPPSAADSVTPLHEVCAGANAVGGGPGVRPRSGATIQQFVAGKCGAEVARLRRGGVLVLGGTPNSILKLAEKTSDPATSGAEGCFEVPLLVVDEASMMVLPCFLALASLVAEEGEILLAGDHRQLAPIVGHDWEQEDRPPAVVYQPYVSAYVAVQNLKLRQDLPDASVLRSALSYSFRLPPAIRELLGRLYQQDEIALAGRQAEVESCRLRVERSGRDPGSGLAELSTLNSQLSTRRSRQGWERVWSGGGGLFLVTHDERESRQSNTVEAAILREILVAGSRLGALGPGSVGIVMPHRAQRALVRTQLVEFREAADVIDTVERLQGGERDTILVSATASSPAAIGAQAEFLLSVNRANVAFSRARRRLIVVCARTLLEHIPPELEQYQAAVLWKSLRSLCSEVVAECRIGRHWVTLATMDVAPQSRDLA